jgi:glycosyltransferase involved in cell wall biosynthesis
MKKVSVFLITYKHEQYIAETIESIVSQKVNFDFEIVIGEDKSPDNTRAICEKYAAQYPHLIKLLPSDKNHGPMGNGIRTWYACTGEYIATCEGDDYWSDPYKLQKQVDFLDSNPDFTMCFSSVHIIDELNADVPYEYFFPVLKKDVFTIEDFIQSDMNIIPTPTLLYRSVVPMPFPQFFLNAIAGDLPLQLLAADKGKAKYFSEKMAVYRNHGGGVTKSAENIAKGDDAKFLLYQEADKYFDHKYTKLFSKKLLQMTKERIIFGSRNKGLWFKMKNMAKYMPDYIRYSDRINYKEIAYYNAILFFPWLLRLNKKS